MEHLQAQGKLAPKGAKKMAMGGEVMEPTTYRARGGEVSCARCGEVTFVPMKARGGEVGDGLRGNMKELYVSAIKRRK
jgi:hypothetical protein